MVCSFLSISKQKLCLFFSRVWRIKKNFLGSILDPVKIWYFVVNSLEKNKQNFCFKIDKKPHTKHHQINQFSWFLIDLMMFGMQFFVNFETKIMFSFLEGMVYKKILFGGLFWIHLKSDILLSILLRKMLKTFLSKLTKTAYQTSSNQSNFHGFDRFDDAWHTNFFQIFSNWMCVSWWAFCISNFCEYCEIQINRVLLK